MPPKKFNIFIIQFTYFLSGESMSIVKIFFSPSGTCKKVVEQICSNFKQDQKSYNLLIFKSSTTLSSEDIAVVVMPVFSGRIPKTARERLSQIKGDNTPAIAIVNYGNAQISDSLRELVDLLDENNFNVIVVGLTVSHYSIFDGVAVGRPDSEDIAKIDEFSQKCIEKLETGESLSAEIPGNKPYSDYKQLPFVVSCDESVCVFYYDCINICPENAIPDVDPIDIDLDLCTRCTACINICPENARMFSGEAFETKKPLFESANSERKEPEFYL